MFFNPNCLPIFLQTSSISPRGLIAAAQSSTEKAIQTKKPRFRETAYNKEQMLIKNRIKIETKLKEMCELVSVVRESLTRYKTTVQALGLLVSFS